jgi:hypothetical protein
MVQPTPRRRTIPVDRVVAAAKTFLRLYRDAAKHPDKSVAFCTSQCYRDALETLKRTQVITAYSLVPPRVLIQDCWYDLP